jgi:decaprenylphospho-beta-D-erythro-pentofuranosid-2-ulose 2-reductase
MQQTFLYYMRVAVPDGLKWNYPYLEDNVSDLPVFAPATPLHPRRRGILVGASGGIGSVLSRKLASEGYTLALVDRNKTALQSLRDEINQTAGETRAIIYEHDVTDYDSVPNLLRRIIADIGGLDLFVYIAGVIYFPDINEFNFKEDRKVMEVNLLGAMAWMSEIAPLFQSAKSGQIVGVSSVAGDRGRVANPANSTSKAGLTAYIESLRNRLTRHGVHVMTVKPGMVKTDMLSGTQKTAFVVEPDKAVDMILNGIHKRRQTIYVSGIWRWIMLVIRHIPSFIFRRLSF